MTQGTTKAKPSDEVAPKDEAKPQQ
jgi:hypothetical protein